MTNEIRYIGLNDYARKWVDTALAVESWKMSEGLFGKVYHLPPPPGPNLEMIAVEVVQATYWEEGQMVFTHLHTIIVKESGYEFDCGHYFSWMLDPSMESGYDRSTGRFYV